MKSIDIKAVAAAIDATGNVEKGTQVGIKYVSADGDIKHLIISKRVKAIKKLGQVSKPNPSRVHFKSTGMIPILDHSKGEGTPKDIFMYGIIGFQPNPEEKGYYKVTRA